MAAGAVRLAATQERERHWQSAVRLGILKLPKAPRKEAGATRLTAT